MTKKRVSGSTSRITNIISSSERVDNIWNSLDNKTVTSESLKILKGNPKRLRSENIKGGRSIYRQQASDMLHDLLSAV